MALEADVLSKQQVANALLKCDKATLHMDVLMLFHNIWSNKECQAFSILEYILKVGGDSSLTFMTSQTH